MTALVRALSRTPTHSSAATATTRTTAGRLTVPPSPGGPAMASGSETPKQRVQQLLQVAAPAHGDRRDRHAVLEDQVPADDPRDELAERRVGVGVGRARDRDRRGQLGVAQRAEDAGDAGQREAEDDRRAGEADGLADDHEDAGADDGAEAHRGEAERADGLRSPPLVARPPRQVLGPLARDTGRGSPTCPPPLPRRRESALSPRRSCDARRCFLGAAAANAPSSRRGHDSAGQATLDGHAALPPRRRLQPHRRPAEGHRRDRRGAARARR